MERVGRTEASPGLPGRPELQLADVQALAGLGLWDWDLATGQVRWSEGIYKVLGMARETYTPSFEDFITRVETGERTRVAELIRATLRDGQPCTFDCPIRLSDGIRRWIRVHAVSEQDSSGATIRLYGTAQDITDMRTPGPGPGGSGGTGMLHDPLTGLANWALFSDRAEAALARAERARTSTALMVIDLDQFHRLNDRLGHSAGDAVLMEVARRLDAAFRPYDTVARIGTNVARLGGDEFLVICEAVPDLGAARTLAQRVGALLAEPFPVEGTPTVTAGVGVALAAPGDYDVDGLLTQAEAAMRAAKAKGPGAYSIFGPDMEELDDSPDAADDLRRALAEGQFRIHYQPKLALDTDRIVGAEALIRWEHPELGMVPPMDFVPLAEKTRLIGPIGAWVMRQACAQAVQWQRAFPDRPPLVVSVNVSPVQFSPELVQLVEAVLEETGLQPASLCLEVTESLLMADLEGAVGVLKALAELGVGLSIDDFGTGYSSLSYLRQFPLHELKIDKSFVDGLDRNPNDTAIVAAVVAMAHALQLSVVAEGVETVEQLERLRTLGCQQAQGFYFARPGPAGAMEELLAAEAHASWTGHVIDGVRPAGYRPDRVLVVDDAADVRQLAVMSLAAVGFEVQEASDGMAALTAAVTFRPDCVLLDLEMPDLDGLQVCRSLRADQRTADCTILILTANDDSSGKVEAFSYGADDYIIKPFTPRDLAGRVNAALRRRRSGS